MELFTTLFSDLLVFVYHCFDRIVIHSYLSGLSRPEQVVHFFRQVVGAPVVSKELLSKRTSDYQNWVEASARNHKVPIQWAEKWVRKEDLCSALVTANGQEGCLRRLLHLQESRVSRRSRHGRKIPGRRCAARPNCRRREDMA
jgi:hypothetical protein